MRDVIDRSLSQRRLTMILLVVFGAAALLLASVGVYGVVAFAVTQRLREFGIRVALGAERSAVTRLVVGQGATMALVGTAIGLVAAVAAGGVMSTLVFETSPRDLGTFALAGAVLLGVAALASYVPARRAAGVDPAVTLRSD
jgi:ABC-type antimicrobial peptide transport system permease subunit